MRLSFFSSQYQAIQRVAAMVIVAPLVLSQFHVWREVGRSNLVPGNAGHVHVGCAAKAGRGHRCPTKWDRFPDGTEVVGIGVLPDVAAGRTREDVATGRDAVLEAAIRLASR